MHTDKSKDYKLSAVKYYISHSKSQVKLVKYLVVQQKA